MAPAPRPIRVRRPWFLASAALLAACSTAPDTASCSPCAGPGFLATGLPEGIDRGVVQTCVGHEPCSRRRITHSLTSRSLELLQLPSSGGWQGYDGAPVSVRVSSAGRHWQGSGDLVFHDAGDGICSCSSLVADVAMESFSPDDSQQR